MAQFMLNPLTLSNINRFSKFFHCQNQEKIWIQTPLHRRRHVIITKNPTTHQICRYITLWNVSVLKATIIENKKAVLPQGNRAMPQVFFSVEVRQQHSLQV